MTKKPTYEEMQAALEAIWNWQMPATGEFHASGNPVSYATLYGSNGERDFIRKIAGKALGLL